MSIQKVPNQRVIAVNKEKCNTTNLYTANNLAALDEAANRLQTKAGFKLYMYIAKNQDKYKFALSSSDFMLWAGVAITAYNSAFNELVEQGYLELQENKKDTYSFYDKSRKPLQIIPDSIIEIPEEKVDEIQQVKKEFDEDFNF